MIHPLRNEATRKLLTDALGITADDFQGKIDPRDEMYLYNLRLLHDDPACAAVLYFMKGHQVATAICEVGRLLFADGAAVESFLDFGSGFGRSTRFLIRKYPSSRVWVSDVVAAAVDFQRDTFQVNGFYSSYRPDEVVAGRRFQFVFASSLFSHLPEATFGPWLRRLFGLVEDGGLLAFSVLDRSEIAGEGGTEGLVFHPESESTVLDAAEYGTAYVTEDFVLSTLRSELGDGVKVRRLRRALCSHQDLYVVTRDGPDLGGLRVEAFPRGELDAFERHGGQATIAGWADAAESVRLLVRGEPVGAVEVHRLDDGTLRWTATLDLEDVGLDDMVAVLARSSAGRENVVALGTLRPYV